MGNLSFSIYAFIPFLTLLQGLIFAILLILRGRREERYSDNWLAFVLFMLAINGIPYMLGWIGITYLWEKLTYLPWDGFWLVIPPATYLFLKSLTNDTWRFSTRRDLWHFWAYGLYFIEHLIVGIWALYDKSILDKWGQTTAFVIYGWLMDWGTELYYFFLCFRLYKEYREWTVNEFSDAERVSFKWVRNYLIVKVALTLVAIANSIYVKLSPDHGENYYALMWCGYLMDTILMYYLSISGYSQTRVRSVRFVENFVDNSFEAVNAANTEGVSDNTLEELKNKNTLSESDLNAWKMKLLSIFDTKKPYLNPDLTLSDLADSLKTNTSILSQVINTGFSKNFNDFVNEYRVKDFKDKIATPQYQHLTLLAIAFECGFNSKSTFNRAVKKATNQMPSELFKER